MQHRYSSSFHALLAVLLCFSLVSLSAPNANVSAATRIIYVNHAAT